VRCRGVDWMGGNGAAAGGMGVTVQDGSAPKQGASQVFALRSDATNGGMVLAYPLSVLGAAGVPGARISSGTRR
jgi:hypothetical protein